MWRPLQRRFGLTMPYAMSTVPRQEPPVDLCVDRRFNSLALIGGNFYAFKDEYVWKLTEQFQVMPGYPQGLRQLFPQLPANVRRIDAAYQRQSDNAVILFNGEHEHSIQGHLFILWITSKCHFQTINIGRSTTRVYGSIRRVRSPIMDSMLASRKSMPQWFGVTLFN